MPAHFPAILLYHIFRRFSNHISRHFFFYFFAPFFRRTVFPSLIFAITFALHPALFYFERDSGPVDLFFILPYAFQIKYVQLIFTTLMLPPVFGFRDILVRTRIRIHGSIPLLKDPDSDPAIFVCDLQVKKNFLITF